MDADAGVHPAHHVRALFVTRDAAEAARWADAARDTVILHATPATTFEEALASLPERRYDVIVAAHETSDGPVRTLLRSIAVLGDDVPTIVVGTVDRDSLAELFGLGAIDVVRFAEIDRLGASLLRAVRIATISRALRQARHEVHALRSASRADDSSAMMRQLPAMVWTTDRNLIITSMHGSVAGRTADDDAYIGMRVATSNQYGEAEDRSVSLYAHRRALAGDTGRYEINWAGRLRQAQVDPLRDAAGAIVGSIGVAIDVTDMRETEWRIAHLATHDLLTDLPNRSLFEVRVQSALAGAERDGRHTGVVFLDIDRFKAINELAGHAGGDEVLRSLAFRLRRAIGENDVISRFGGCTFVVLFSDVASAADAHARAEAIVAAARAPIHVDEHEIYLTLSAGVSTFPDDANEGAMLVASAETAMYEAKRMGRNMVRAYTPSMAGSPTERQSMQRDLHHAIERNELELYYQPMYDIETRAITGVEALLRWRHPVHGMLLPDRFIPIAEESGAIERIGDWVIARACEQIRDWKDAGIARVRVSVNVSARQFESPDLLDRIYGHVQRCMIPPSALEIEVTESSIMRDVPAAIRLLCDLKEIGLRVSIDDFGTGYTSLRFLKRFPVDVLKIDRSFIRDVATGVFDGAIVRAVTTLARTLGVVTIAEGVEVQAQFDRLRDLECDEVQGFLFSHPLRVQDCTPLLLAHTSASA